MVEGDNSTLSPSTVKHIMPRGKKPLSESEVLRRVEERYGDEYTVLGAYVTMHTPIRLRHNVCGHEWETTAPYDFLKPKANTCPQCSHPSRPRDTDWFKAKVAELEGDRYVVLGEYSTNKTKLLMRHTICGHEWEVKPNLFLNGTRCPKCRTSPSKGVREIKDLLGLIGIRFLEEHPYEGMVLEAQLRFDLYLPDHRIAIEYDGEQHFKPKRGGESEFRRTQARDSFKDAFCDENQIHLIRVPYTERRVSALVLDRLKALGV